LLGDEVVARGDPACETVEQWQCAVVAALIAAYGWLVSYQGVLEFA
jgi:hypothetical protein